MQASEVLREVHPGQQMAAQMIEVKKILVGVELSPRTGKIPQGSTTAFEQACRLAEKTGAQLRVLHSSWHAGEIWPLSDKGRAALHMLRDEAAGRGVSTILEVTEERAWVALCLAAKRGSTDLVILGRREKEGSETKGRPVGSVGAKVLRHCPVPVWVVKPAHDLEHKLILAAMDFSKVGNQVLEHAAYLACRTGASLHVVHAYDIPRELAMSAGDLDKEEYDARVEVLKAQAQAELDERLLRVELTEPATTHLMRKSAHAAIKETVEHLHPDVLVMGSLSKGGRPGYQLGETAERLFGALECSVLSLKPVGFHCALEEPVGQETTQPETKSGTAKTEKNDSGTGQSQANGTPAKGSPPIGLHGNPAEASPKATSGSLTQSKAARPNL